MRWNTCSPRKHHIKISRVGMVWVGILLASHTDLHISGRRSVTATKYRDKEFIFHCSEMLVTITEMLIKIPGRYQALSTGGLSGDFLESGDIQCLFAAMVILSDHNVDHP